MIRAPLAAPPNSCGPQPKLRPGSQFVLALFLFLFFALFLTAAFACQRFLYAPLLTWLEVEGVTLDLLDDVLLLYLALEATQSVFKRLTFLQSNFRQRTLHPLAGPGGRFPCYIWSPARA